MFCSFFLYLEHGSLHFELRAGSGVERISLDPLHFLAAQRRLNQPPSVLSHPRLSFECVLCCLLWPLRRDLPFGRNPRRDCGQAELACVAGLHGVR